MPKSLKKVSMALASTISSNTTESKTSPPWSELHIDIKIFVSQRLNSYRDFIRFGSVCKPWREAVQVIQGRRRTNISNHNMPWVMTYGCFCIDKWYGITLELSDPLTRETYNISKIVGERERQLFDGATVCASKYGWLLLSKKLDENEGVLFFFYNPFQNKIVHVPSLLSLDHNNVNYVPTFTAPPPSADHGGDCVIYVLENTSDHYCIVRTFNLTDGTTTSAWTTLTGTYGLGTLVDELTYKDGTLFCKSSDMSPLGTYLMCTFNIARDVWEAKPLLFLATIDGKVNYSQLVEDESDGSIYWLVCQKLPKWEGFKYDGPLRNWFKVENMKEIFGNKICFLRCSSSSTAVELSPLPVLGAAAAASGVWELQKVDGQSDLLERCQEFQFNGEAVYNSIREYADDFGVTLTTTLIQPPQLCYNRN